MPARIVIIILAITLAQIGAQAQFPARSVAQPTTPIPSECDKPELLVKGRPIMTPARKDHLAVGISLDRNEFKPGEPILLHIWVDNPGDVPASVQSCGDLDFFKAYGIEFFGADGRRILSQSDKKLAEQCRTAQSVGRACTMNGAIPVPAHTCERMGSVNLYYLFPTALRNNHDLPPGKYTIRLPQASGGDMCKMEEENLHSISPGPALTFSVEQP